MPWSGIERNWSAMIRIERHFGSMPWYWSALIDIDRHWAMIEGVRILVTLLWPLGEVFSEWSVSHQCFLQCLSVFVTGPGRDHGRVSDGLTFCTLPGTTNGKTIVRHISGGENFWWYFPLSWHSFLKSVHQFACTENNVAPPPSICLHWNFLSPRKLRAKAPTRW